VLLSISFVWLWLVGVGLWVWVWVGLGGFVGMFVCMLFGLCLGLFFRFCFFVFGVVLLVFVWGGLVEVGVFVDVLFCYVGHGVCLLWVKFFFNLLCWFYCVCFGVYTFFCGVWVVG
jgi:hypothetical protein